MISPWKMIKLSQKWQKVAVLRRKRISFPRADGGGGHPLSSEAPCVAQKGHFVVYTAGQKQLELPIKYLSNYIIRELFRLFEEEFGLPGDGPITLPCDANSMEHIFSLVQGNNSKDLQKYNLILSFPTNGCSSSIHHRHVRQQLLACS